MIIYNALRMMGDLAFYYTFAGCIGACFGCGWLIIPLVIQSVCYGCGACVKKKALGLMCLLPMILCFILPGYGLVEWILMAAPTIYVIYMRVTNNHALVWAYQVDKFGLFIKIFPIFAVLMSLVGFYKQVAAAAVPMALIMVFVTVLLMRSLRHEPHVYLQKKYQVVNGISLVIILAVTGLFSSKFILVPLGKALLWIYKTIIAPILIGAAWCLGYVLSGISYIFKWLAEKLGGTKELPSAEMTIGVPEEIMEHIEAAGGGKSFFTDVLLAIAIIAVVIVIIRVFIWLGRKNQVEHSPVVVVKKSSVADESKVVQTEQPDSNAVWQVRRLYRKFLKLYTQKVAEVHKSNTSEDIRKRAEYTLKNESLLGEMRDIYIRARYGKDAGREDVKRMKAIYMQLKEGKY